MTNTTTQPTEKMQQDADQIIGAAQALERAAKMLRQRAKWLRAGRSVEATQGPGADLEWAESDRRNGADAAARALRGEAA